MEAQEQQGKCVMEAAPPENGDGDEPRVFLDRDAIEAVEDRQTTWVDIPEWGGVVGIRVISGRERDCFEASLQGKGQVDRLIDFRARFAVLVCCDDQGKPLFVPKDIDWLSNKSCAALDRIFDVGLEINRMTPSDVGELVKNSERDRSDSSGSDSPES